MVTHFRRIVVALATVASAALTIVTSMPVTAAAVTYPVVGSGDSILGMSLQIPAPGGAYMQNGYWIDVEYGRNAYQVGMAGRATTAAVVKLAIERSQPGGWIVVQDNALGTTDWEWRKLMTWIVDNTPADRCLLGVLPGFRADVNAQHAADVARRATIMGQVFMTHPCRAFVYLNSYLQQNPGQFPDGQHPDARAQTWIRGQVLGTVN